jgi:hypothetical protein
MALLFILTVVLLIAIVGSLPIWPHSKQWGYLPITGIVGVAGLLLLVFLFGRHGGLR